MDKRLLGLKIQQGHMTEKEWVKKLLEIGGLKMVV